MSKEEENQEYIQNMNLTTKLINQRPGRMMQLASLLNRYDAHPKDWGDDDSVTMTEIGILVYVSSSPGTTNALLCEQFGRTKGAISQLIKKLDTKGYIMRESNPADAKSNFLYPTLKGMKLIQKVNNSDMNDESGMLRRMLQMCSLEEIQTFYRMVDTYIALLTTEMSKKEQYMADHGTFEDEKESDFDE